MTRRAWAALLMILTLPPALTGEAQVPAARVEVAAVVSAPMEDRLTLTGDIRSPQQAPLSSQIDGYVTEVRVLPGDRVEANQVVVTLDDELPRLELQRLEAALAEAESLYADQQRRTLEAEGLIEDNNVSRSEYESLLAATLASESRVRMIRVEKAMQEVRVQHHTVEASFPGVVTEKLVDEGQRVTGSTPLLLIARMDPLWVDVRVPQRYLGQVVVGSAVRISPGGPGGQGLRASVKWVVPVSTDGTRTFLVRTEVDNADWRLAPGMSAQVELGLGDGAGGPRLQVPADAVVRLGDDSLRVWVVDEEEGAAVARPLAVTLGRRSGELVEIVSGDIGVADRVVVRGNEGLQEGQGLIVHRRDDSNS
jgi:membrane fusion protein (multidrug efflux system)